MRLAFLSVIVFDRSHSLSGPLLTNLPLHSAEKQSLYALNEHSALSNQGLCQ